MPQSKNGNSAGGMATFEDRLSQNLQKAQAAAKQSAATTEQSAPGDLFQERLRNELSRANGPDGAFSDVVADRQEAIDTDELANAEAGPVGDGEHVVRQGECVSSIAKQAGHSWDTVWNDAANAELRERRKDPNVLLPEDRIHVPALRQKQEPGQTEMRHRFRRHGWPEMFRVRVLRDEEPRGNEPYELEVDGRRYNGTTDADGNLSVAIAPDARRATLQVGTELDVDEHVFKLGGLDPVDEISGVQGRLNNLGFDCGKADGILGPRTRRALRKFQKKREQPVTGDADEATRRRLQADYGC